MASQGTFATAFNCMDGRCQEKAFAYTKQLSGADHIDMITEPGIDGLLAGAHSVVPEAEIAMRADWIRSKAEISAKGHGSKLAVIFGHCECAGNQAELEVHKNHVLEAKKTVEEWGLFEKIHLAVFNNEFEVEEVV